MMRWKITGLPRTQNISCSTRYSIVQKLSNKQSAKVICRFDRLTTSHSNRQKSHISIEKLSSSHVSNYIVHRVNHGLTSSKDLATALYNPRQHNGYSTELMRIAFSNRGTQKYNLKCNSQQDMI